MAAPPRPRPRLLLYAMYDPTAQDSAPKVRIRLIAEALAAHADLAVVSGTRGARVAAGLRWMRAHGAGSIDAVYVESASSAPTPFDLALLLWLRLRGRRIGVFFRDAYQLFRDLYPLRRGRQRLADAIWHVTMPLLRAVSDVAFAPSRGLATALGIHDPVLLPPGTDPRQPYLGPGTTAVVAAITPLDDPGVRLLVDAIRLVRERRPDASVLLIGTGNPPAALPGWVDVRRSERGDLAAVLAPVAICAIPRVITRYTDLAVPLKLTDYLALGKPIVATACAETSALIGESGAALLTADTPAELAAAILGVLDDPALARSLAERARSLAKSDGWTWDGRARRIVDTLVPDIA